MTSPASAQQTDKPARTRLPERASTRAAAAVPAQLDPNAVYAELSRQYGLAFGELIHLRLVNAQQAEQITQQDEELRYLRSLQPSPEGGS